MRISGGIAKSISLKCPPGKTVRPATDFTRAAVFSSLGNLIQGSSFLDLFSGTGAYGLEALSRGATRGVFVEKNNQAIACIKENLSSTAKSLQLSELQDFSIRHQDALSFTSSEKFDLVFVDPPYELIRSDFLSIFKIAAASLKNIPSARLIFEMPADFLPPSSPLLLEELKKLGKSGINQPTVRLYGWREVS
ncbi:MAG: hypothetical protein A2007_03855 [Verrucomicrobia bacterium GWC2_42_7]|nr:MAG: hypothetical protein A2007_03855 [Verrucomicrobia bacterium GWC2_42_7]